MRVLCLRSLPLLAMCAGLGLGAGAHAADLNAEERLEAVRHQLLQEALKGTVQVRSTAWIDATGALRESSSFRHGMQVRGVRVLGYERDESGQPRAQVQWQGREDLVKAAAAPVPSSKAPAKVAAKAPATNQDATACAEPGRLRPVVDWAFSAQGRWTVDEAPLVQDAGQTLVQAWLQSAAAARTWTLVQAPAASPVPVHSTSQAYERVLTAASAPVPAGWLARLHLEALPPPPASATESLFSRELAPVRVRVALSVSPTAGGQAVYEARGELNLQTQPRGWAPPRLTPASQAQLAQWMGQWSQDVGERLACQGVKVQVLQTQADRVQVDQGALAGMRVGEEWLISDRQQVPQRLIEPGAASRLVLARVERVEAQRAELKVLAGPAEQVQARWQAWPLQMP